MDQRALIFKGKLVTLALIIGLIAFFFSFLRADAQTNPGLRLNGAFTVNDCIKIINRTTAESAGAPCGAGGGGVSITSPLSTITVTPSPLTGVGTIELPSTVTAGGPIGSGTVTPVVTWDTYGRITALTSATITPPFSAITGNLTLSQFPSIANLTALGNISGGASVPSALTVTQITANLVADCSATVAGKVPTPPNNTTTFLRGDCSFAVIPAASTTVPGIAEFATAAEYRANTSGLVLTTDQVWSSADFVTLTDAATVAVDFSAGYNFTLSIGGNRTLGNPTNTKNGQTGVIYVVQTGGSNTLAYDTNYKWAGGTACVLSTAAGAVDRLTYIVRSSTFIDIACVKDIK